MLSDACNLLNLQIYLIINDQLTKCTLAISRTNFYNIIIHIARLYNFILHNLRRNNWFLIDVVKLTMHKVQTLIVLWLVYRNNILLIIKYNRMPYIACSKHIYIIKIISWFA